MEQNQTHQMVAWLDEERRKDKAVIARLEERTSAQAALIEDQNRRLQALENTVASLRASILSPSFVNDTVSRLRNELTETIDQVEKRRSAVQQDLKRLRDQDREAFNRSIAELRDEFDARFEREMQPRRVEEERLSRVAAELQVYADNLSKGLEDFERSLAFLEEQRRQDTKRLSETSSQVMDIAKRQETQITKIELLEELSRRNEKAIDEARGNITEVKQQRQIWLEQEALASQRREQAINDMLRRMDHYEEQVDGYIAQFNTYTETHRDMRKTIDDFERLADRVDRRINELAETQRISEDRFRQEYEEFLQDDQKRWRQFTLTNEEQWRENGKNITNLTERLEQASAYNTVFVEHIRHLHRVQNDTIRDLADAFHTRWEATDDGSKGLPPLSL